jgi:maltose/maltodextrin transport system substrate-binding protein
MCWAHDRVGEWAKSGLVVPVRPAKALRAQIDDAAWAAFTYRGQTWGYPLAIETIGLIYNKALVKKPPASFEELIALDRELVKQGKKAILWDYNKSFFTWPLLAAGGDGVFGRDAQGGYDTTKVGVNGAGALRGAQVLEQLIARGVMPRGARYSDMEAQFSAGKTAMMIAGPWAWDNIRKSRIDFGVAPIPSIGGKPAKPFVGVLGCMVSAPSKQKDIAREFLEHWVLKVENLKIISADVPLGTPANKAYFAELANDPHIAATMANARAGEAIPNIPETGRFWPAVDAALEAISQGRQSPRDALNGAAERMKVK